VFDWDDDNIDHIRRHGVDPEEAEEAVTDPRRIGTPAYSTSRESRFAVFGTTEAGRLLFVVFTRRRLLIRVITARDAAPNEKRQHRR
jgi:uncharacterized DUF497 family protein